MPRYLMETDVVGSSELDDAVHLAAARFPEVAVEHCCTASDDRGDRVLWICRAPSANHLRRWAEAARLPQGTPRRIDRLRGSTEQDGRPPSRSIPRPPCPDPTTQQAKESIR